MPVIDQHSDFLTQDFDWDSIDPDHAAMLEAGACIISARTLRDVMAWIHECPRRQATLLRARLVWWMIDGAQQNVKLTEFAESLGVKKQSLCRLCSQFRRRFHFVPHGAKTKAARMAYMRLQTLKKLQS